MKLWVANRLMGTLVQETGFLHYEIDHKFNEPAVAVVEISDPDRSVYQKYRTADQNIYAHLNDGGVYFDETSDAASTTADDVILLPAVPAVNDAFYFGYTEEFEGMLINITTNGDWVSADWYGVNGKFHFGCPSTR